MPKASKKKHLPRAKAARPKRAARAPELIPAAIDSNRYAREALTYAVSIAVLASFGRFEISSRPGYEKPNSIDVFIGTKADELVELIASCLPIAEAEAIAARAQAQGIERDALDCGLDPIEAREIAGSTDALLFAPLTQPDSPEIRKLLLRYGRLCNLVADKNGLEGRHVVDPNLSHEINQILTRLTELGFNVETITVDRDPSGAEDAPR
jgi:hypothetical protein